MNQIDRIVERLTDGEERGALSTSELIAIALVWNRMDWLPEPYTHPLAAIDRLGVDWLRMCIDYRLREQRQDRQLPPVGQSSLKWVGHL